MDRIKHEYNLLEQLLERQKVLEDMIKDLKKYEYILSERTKILEDMELVESGEYPKHFENCQEMTNFLKEQLENNTEMIDDLLLGRI
jgi:hypothetical protein